MILNATILSLSRGQIDWAGESALVAVDGWNGTRCCFDQPTNSQRFMLGVVVRDVVGVLYVPHSSLGGMCPALGDVLIVQLDSGTLVQVSILKLTERVKDGGLSHWEAFLSAAGNASMAAPPADAPPAPTPPPPPTPPAPPADLVISILANGQAKTFTLSPGPDGDFTLTLAATGFSGVSVSMEES